jgi:hypothetical protein
MWNMLMAIAIGCLASSSTSATPLLPVSTTAHALVHSDAVQIRSKAKVRPYGWSKGRKVGWRGRSLPPGQAKKFR